MTIPTAPGRLLGIGGFRRAGKTTLARFLEDEHRWVHETYAAPIRGLICAMWGITLYDLEAIKEEPQSLLGGRTPREVMQLLGTEWMREYCGQNVWVDALHTRIALARSARRDVVISDVRFENEARSIRAQGGQVIWIHRPGKEGGEHISERGLPSHLIDHEIVNEYDRDFLKQMARIFHQQG